MHNGKTCAGRYEQLAVEREMFLNRARDCSEVTIPTLVPPSGHSSATEYNTPYQGVGARGVNNLASKLLLSLLPPNSPFFRLQVDDQTLTELTGEEGARAKVEEGLNQIERSVMTEIETTGLRSPIFEALKHLIVGGNVLVYLPKSGGIRVFRLDSYVVTRDPYGNVLEIITKEEVSPAVLEEKELAALGADPEADMKAEYGKKVALYTHMYLDGKTWRMYQEIKGQIIPDSGGSWPIDKSPMLALRWTRIDSESYGRSYVDEYLGDLISLEGLSKAVVEAAAASSKVLFMVNPNGTTRMRDISQAENCAIVAGNANEVSVLQTEKYADMRVAYDTVRTITERLSYAFLMNSAVQRSGERVTAEEVRFMAKELEDALGGVYSILSQEFQLPLVNRLMDRMTKAKRLPALPKGIVRPAIVTGLEALGRGHDLNKYNAFLTALQPLGAEAVAQYMNVSDYITRIGTALGIDMDGLVKTQEDIQAEQQAAAEAQQEMMMNETMGRIAEKATPGAMNIAQQGLNDGNGNG